VQDPTEHGGLLAPFLELGDLGGRERTAIGHRLLLHRQPVTLFQMQNRALTAFDLDQRTPRGGHCFGALHPLVLVDEGAFKGILAAVEIAGEAVGLQMGLSFAGFFDPDSGQINAVSRLLNTLSLAAFVAINGPLLLLAAAV